MKNRAVSIILWFIASILFFAVASMVWDILQDSMISKHGRCVRVTGAVYTNFQTQKQEEVTFTESWPIYRCER